MITQWSYFFFNKTNLSKNYKNKSDSDKRYNVSKTFSNYKDLFIENKIDYNNNFKKKKKICQNCKKINYNSDDFCDNDCKFSFLLNDIK